VAVCLILALLAWLADSEHRHIRNGGGEVYQVTLADGSAPVERVLLGTTVQFVFLYDRASERVFIHPNENVLTLSGVPAEAGLEPSQRRQPTPSPEDEATEAQADELNEDAQ
jgi:hypothetical protein